MERGSRCCKVQLFVVLVDVARPCVEKIDDGSSIPSISGLGVPLKSLDQVPVDSKEAGIAHMA